MNGGITHTYCQMKSCAVNWWKLWNEHFLRKYTAKEQKNENAYLLVVLQLRLDCNE